RLPSDRGGSRRPGVTMIPADGTPNRSRAMRRILRLLVPLVVLTGCTRFEGPLQVRQKDRADAPGYTIPEQRLRARQRHTFIEADPRTVPGAQVDRPSPIGR